MTTALEQSHDRGLRASARTGAGVALAGAALIHSTVMGEHLDEWVLAGLFFLTLVGLETALALATVYAWGRPAARAVVLSGVVTVAIWLVSRTVGLPLGPADFQEAEAVGVPDLASCLLELGAVALAWRTAVSTVALPSHAEGARELPTSHRRWFTVAVTVAALSITAWGVRPALAHDDPTNHHQHEGSS